MILSFLLIPVIIYQLTPFFKVGKHWATRSGDKDACCKGQLVRKLVDMKRVRHKNRRKHGGRLGIRLNNALLIGYSIL